MTQLTTEQIREKLDKLHDEIFEGAHHDECALIQIEGCHTMNIDDSECDCGFELVCELAGVASTP